MREFSAGKIAFAVAVVSCGLLLKTAGAAPGQTGTILEAFKPGTAPPDSYSVIGASSSGAITVSPEADRAVTTGTGGLY